MNAKMGRPLKTIKADRTINLRITEEQKYKWKAAANRANMSLSEWIKFVIDQEILKE